MKRYSNLEAMHLDGDLVLASDYAALEQRLAEIEALAHHLRHCRGCGETDVLDCDIGGPMWRDAFDKPKENL